MIISDKNKLLLLGDKINYGVGLYHIKNEEVLRLRNIRVSEGGNFCWCEDWVNVKNKEEIIEYDKKEIFIY